MGVMSEKRDERNIERLTPIGDALKRGGFTPREHLPYFEPLIDRAHRLNAYPEAVRREALKQAGKALGLDE